VVARSEVAWAVRNGHLVREPCSQCGALKAEAHHEDYTKPLEVVWLCRRHHKLRHAEIKRQGITIRPEPTTPHPRRKPGPKNRLNTKTALVTFGPAPEVRKALERAAAADQCSMSFLVTKITTDWAKAHGWLKETKP
jgi:hypothetical protein